MRPLLSNRAVLPLGDEAVLIECADLADVAAVAAWCSGTKAAAADSSTGAVLEIVPGAATVMIRGLPLGRLLALANTVPALLPPVDNGDGDEVRIPVLYRGEDLAGTAEAVGVSIERLVGLHTSARWTVAFVGFAPGFGYLHSPDWGLQLPRHGVPRASVPAGAVALADGFSGVYPRSSPGGWQLIGSTDAPLWDVDRVPPALLRPGTSVRFDELR